MSFRTSDGAPRAPLASRFAGRLSRMTWVDVVVAAAVLVLLYLVLKVGQGTTVRFSTEQSVQVDTDPARLPYDAARSLLRMFAALAASIVFTFAYAYAAAKSRRLERILIPALDILQSVPVLGFLTVAVTGFLALFPGSMLGLECASIFAIFTSQAWNMTFGFYQSLTSLPRELDELSRSFRFTKWMRFWKVEVPAGMIGLVWNGMMSFGGGWFFLVASEAISVNNKEYALPGVGSYAGAAVTDGDLGKVGWAILTMAVMVIGVNFLFWRPLTAWAEKFRNEQSEASEAQRSVVLDFLRRSHWPRLLGALLRPAGRALGRAARVLGTDDRPLSIDPARRRTGDIAFAVVAGGLIVWGLADLGGYLHESTGLGVFGEPLLLGLVTFVRVVVLVAVATVVWVPVGVWIGFSPRLTRIAQPVVQVLASFPANFLFPLAVWFFLRTGLSIDVGGILLMALGAQWYILFNTIAGAMSIPSDLREAMDDLGVRGLQRWQRLILPGVFPAYVTGGITASGGAWNASIVSEVVTFGGTTLTATGLGAYIARATADGDFPQLLAGVAVMSLYVVGLNRLLWRRLYRLAERRYSL
ncbi:ABC transporter permease [Streptomyces spectabilis]|uniref:ABC transporter permease subunit n=1 Tax=Streptomyces spectabilis TaxID=68270 RepID=A0A5P2X4Z7_STRST|nr:ABC transporter permease subunit [Streptomyces spectabilis]MBB5101643.1 NitT/TauT family transport system permease protein [Streptomyces spectabilis]MCI3900825.1 ABC transporter permease subunit [Streptomyces spectabilis]QEV58349.1 ABC transporter permease subunit [Streptomyces spectabilis]GGV12677.1 ABC transporter permease [Streptomyces spectabilis]